MPTAGVNLNFRDQGAGPDVNVHRSWSGFSVECVRIGQARAFEYDWEGPGHYLAVHDIVLRDGEVVVGGDAAVNCIDLRDRLTFVPQDARVSGWSDLSGDDQGYVALFFDPYLAEAEYERPILGTAVRPLVYFQDSALCRTLRQLEGLVTADGEPDPVAAETLGLLAVLQLYPQLGGTFQQGAGHLTLPQQRVLEDFVEARLGYAISLSELAAISGLSRYHFARSFFRTYGRSPHQYLLLRRISLAATLLTSSTVPVSEIAARVGFSSPARLSIAFRRTVGCSPRAFRQAAR